MQADIKTDIDDVFVKAQSDPLQLEPPMSPTFEVPVSTDLLHDDASPLPASFLELSDLHVLDLEAPTPGADAFLEWLSDDAHGCREPVATVPTACPFHEDWLAEHAASDHAAESHDTEAAVEGAAAARADAGGPSHPFAIEPSAAQAGRLHTTAVLVPQACCVAVPAHAYAAHLRHGRSIAWGAYMRPRREAPPPRPASDSADAAREAKSYVPHSLQPQDRGAMRAAAQCRRQRWELLKVKRAAAQCGRATVRYEKRRVCAVARPRVQGRFVRKTVAPAPAGAVFIRVPTV